MYSPTNTVNHTYGWLVTILSGLFMFLSLFVYRAYHIDQIPAFTGDSMLFRALVHSFTIAAIFCSVEFCVAPRLSINEKTKPLITALISTIAGLNLSFLAFNYFYHWTELYWSSYGQFFYEYPLILVIPVMLSYLIAKLIELRQKGVKELIIFTSDNQKEYFQVKAEHLLYVKSADNYIEIFHQNNQLVDRRLIRKSLKNTEEQFVASDILRRCHRSYLVNPINIDHINKSATKVELNICGDTIPVSKKYVDHFTS